MQVLNYEMRHKLTPKLAFYTKKPPACIVQAERCKSSAIFTVRGLVLIEFVLPLHNLRRLFGRWLGRLRHV